MSTRIRITKDHENYKKGEIVTLRSREAKELIKANVATVQTDIGSSPVTKEVKNNVSKPKAVRSNKSKRR